MSWFLNCEDGPSDQIETLLTVAGMSSSSRLTYTTSVSLECVRLSDATTFECSLPECQNATVNKLTWCCFHLLLMCAVSFCFFVNLFSLISHRD